MLFDELVDRDVHHIVLNSHISALSINKDRFLMVNKNNLRSKNSFDLLNSSFQRLSCIKIDHGHSALEMIVMLLKPDFSLGVSLFLHFELFFNIFSNIIYFVFDLVSLLYLFNVGSTSNEIVWGSEFLKERVEFLGRFRNKTIEDVLYSLTRCLVFLND